MSAKSSISRISSRNITANSISTLTKVRIYERDFKVSNVQSGTNELRELLDVSSENANNGDSLIYNSFNKKYEVKPLDLSNTNIDLSHIDGGIF